jgi:hypothetical protein
MSNMNITSFTSIRFFSSLRILLVGALACVGGCAAYAVPGHGANFRSLGMTPAQKFEQTDPGINASLDKKPLASFPAAVAMVRIEAPNYEARTVQLYGQGNYRVVITRDVEKPELVQKLETLPMLSVLEPLNRLELPENLNNDQELRQAAAMVHADMVLIYTFDDEFEDRDMASILTLFTLGISPNKYLTVTSTASAVLMDTRNGYIYGACEATEKKSTLANCWGEPAAADAVREQVESAAFDKLCGEFQRTWGKVVNEYATPGGAATKP